MGCQIHSSNPQILCRIPKKSSRECLYPFSNVFQLRPKVRLTNTITLSSNQQHPVSTITSVPQTQLQEPSAYTIEFKTLESCGLGIASYPDFKYNAQGGKGIGRGTNTEGSKGETMVDFDVKTLYIPPLTTATTKFLGLPLPPFLRIDIVPELFKGTINSESGQVDLEFKAKFLFSIGSIYKASPLVVETVLTSEESKGTMRNGRGERLSTEGRCRLVGVATVEPINDFLLDSFLGLPTECLADLNASISFTAT
ncbi:uncharacterized protein LOC141708171 [Apium graveolens]|uniref:uncharacterized protein LOC141708171 n=1 Tax=Apium graveolens TaxID=4045 RepID=UPI003D7A939C